MLSLVRKVNFYSFHGRGNWGFTRWEAQPRSSGQSMVEQSPPLVPSLELMLSNYGTVEKTLESPLDCKEMQPVHPKGNQSWIFIGRTDAEAPILWPPDEKSRLIGKDSVAGKEWGQEEKGVTKDEMIGWCHGLNWCESESFSVMSDSLQPHGLYSYWNSSGQNTGVGSLSLLQGIFPTQGWNPGLPHCRWILYQLSHQESPRILEWAAYPFSSRSSQPRNRTGSAALQADSSPAL